MSDVQTAAVIGAGAIGELAAKWLTIFNVSNAALLGRTDKPALNHYDACFEAVGTTDAFRRCVELVKPNGQIAVIGNPDEEFRIDKALYWQILRKQITVYGCWNSCYPDDYQSVLEYAQELHLDDFISHRYEFTTLESVLRMMYNKSEKHRKILVLLR